MSGSRVPAARPSIRPVVPRAVAAAAVLAAALAVAAVLAPPAPAQPPEGEARLMRFPDIHGDRMAFVYAGDIWVVDARGGEAYRLTSHEGLELFPKFSPDGRWIAFSAEYSGNRQVYVISVDGGNPRQLTYYNDVGALPPRGGFDYRVLDWTPDGKEILFRANRLPWGVRMGRPYRVPFEGGMETPLAVPETGGGMLSPDGTKFVYTPIDREFRTWKRHEGGRAQDVWIYDLAANTSERLTDHPRTDNQPVWVGDDIYFASDREDRMNLYRYDRATGGAERITDHRDFDVLWPSAGPDKIVYECGGHLYHYTPSNGRIYRVPVRIRGDFPGTLPQFKYVHELIAGGDVSPSGKRAVFEARGDLFSVPAKEGGIRNLTLSPGVREMDPVWSPDGRWVAYLSDRTGEYELYVRAQDGSGEEKQLTQGGDVWRFPPVWSPDATKLAFGDKKQRLQYVDIRTGKIVEVDRSDRNDITTYVWAPDARWLAYIKSGDSQFQSIWLYSLESRETVRLTDDYTNDYSPAFDPKGRYLYFLSDRDYNLTFSGYEFNYFYTNPTRVYAATLDRDTPSLLRPKSDEEPLNGDDGDEGGDGSGGAGAGADGKGDKDGAGPGKGGKDDRKGRKKGRDPFDFQPHETIPPIEIDVEGFSDRVVVLPGAPGNYGNVTATEKGCLYLRQNGGSTDLEGFFLESEKTETVLSGVDNYVLAANGEHVLYRHGGTSYGIAKVAPGGKAGDGALALDGMLMKVDPAVEWAQIFDDFYRILRDWFYDPGMHGIDWPALRDLYRPLVAHAQHRADLDYIMGEMGSELSAGHFYVNWGDMPEVERRDGGLLGAEIEAHPSGYFRIAKIFPGENWQPAFRSPLTEAGADAREGDFILAVNGRSTKEVQNFYQLMENTAGRQIGLTVAPAPDPAQAREIVVRPVSRETELRYLDWVQSRRETVDRLSGGRIGYIHMPNTAAAGNRELRKWFYPQAHKDALIFDVRYNGGGFIPDRMIELLTRQLLGYWKRRGLEPQQVPGYAHEGPKAALINAYSSSGGDAFPYWFRLTGQGPLFGTRTWGGLIGISGNPGFVDGGSINVPTFRFMDPDGQWAVENEGVPPDVEVIDRPEQIAAGQDPTLEAAIEYLLEELEKNPVRRVGEPAPVRYDR